MPSGTAVPPTPSPETPIAPPTECETVIQRRLQKTQRHVKGTDVAGGLITLAIGVLAYLLAAAAMDHWLVVGGLGSWGRFWLSLLFWGAVATYVAYRLLPPLFGRINPVFAAATIEKSQPSLKNSLVNFLLLRGRRQEVAAPVYQAMEHRAAADLSNVEIDAAVDRTHIIRLGYVLAGVLALFCLYLVVSPKNPIRSAARVLWPWASVEAPTRVTIRDILPGDTVAFHDNHVTVSAEIAGLRKGEPALLIYSTADSQTVDQAIPMTRPRGDYRYQCQFPPGNLGLQQDLKYYLAAGDCRTRRYQIHVEVAPTIVVDKVVYRYPGYTGLADRTVARQGDLRAIEGTEVALHATANTTIKPRSAEIDLGCTGRRGVRMSVDDRNAVGRFTLKTNPDDPSRPKYDSFQLRFADAQGRENQRPIQHRIDVVRDLPPEVELVEPRQEEVRMAVNGKLAIKVRAEDPDFALRRVTLRAQHDGRGLFIAPLLERRKPEKARPGAFSAVYTFEPARLGLKAGDRVEYWVEAQDNKEPTPGRTASGRQWIHITGDDARSEASDDRADEGASDRRNGQDDARAADENATGDQNNGKTTDEDRSESQNAAGSDGPEQPDTAGRREPSDGKSNDGQSSDEQRQSDQLAQASEKPNDRIDPDTAPGDAMQEILNDRQKQQKQSTEDQSPSEDQSSQERSSDQRQQQTGDKSQKSDEQAGGQKPDQPSDGDKSDDAKSGGQKGSGQKSRKEESGGEKGPDQKSGQDKSDTEKGDSRKSGGEQSSGEKGAGESPSKENAPGEQAGQADSAGQGEESAGEKTAAEQDGAGQSGSDKSTDQDAKGRQGAKKSTSDEQRGEETSANEKPRADTTAGQRQESSSTDASSSAQKTSGQRRPDEQSSPGPGQNEGDNAGSPAPQEDNRPRQRQRDNAGKASDRRGDDSAQSPSTSKRESDSQGETAGDRSGGGQKGGGQKADQPGVGRSGSHTAADEGTSASDQQGTGQTGDDAGRQAASKTTTGSAAKRQPAEGDQRTTAEDDRGDEVAGGDRAGDARQKPGRQRAGEKSANQNNAAERGAPQQEPTDGGAPGKGVSEGPVARGSGPPAGGGAPGATSDAAEPSEPIDTPADQANLEYARRQTALALEHLRDQLAKEKPELLELLGWSKDEARRFLERWEQMQRSAVQPGPAGQRSRQHFDNALQSLGLRPRGAELRRGGVTAEDSAGLRDAGRFAPPSDWAEQFRAYTRGITGEDGQDREQ